MGYLSQYFCEKNSLEEEIETITRNAYLYAAGITVFTFVAVLVNMWVFYLGQVIGMMCRIVMTMAIYSKVNLCYLPMLCQLNKEYCVDDAHVTFTPHFKEKRCYTALLLVLRIQCINEKRL